MHPAGLFGAAIGRRSFLQLAGAGALAVALPHSPAQAGRGRSHGLSVFGELRYAADFKHFGYVNPAAPKGGTFRFSPSYWYFNQSTQTFNTLNGLVLSGDAPPRTEYTFDTLMSSALDEPDSVYGRVAAWVEVSEDGNTYRFGLRPEARFHDGSPLTAEDVAFSYGLLKEKAHPQIRESLSELVSATAEGAEVVLVFSGKQNASVPIAATGMPILSKAFYAGEDFTASTLKPPLGSGPYRIGRFETGRFIEYDRVADYWGKDLPVSVGHANFDTLRIVFFQDREPEFQAFTKGEIEWRTEPTSRLWATGYDFPAVGEGKVKKAEFPANLRPTMQGWFINMRRPKFADPRTREALGYCFDFEWTRANLFYGSYDRQISMFEQSDFEASGKPGPDELAIMEPLRDRLPPEAFGEAIVPPVSDGSGRDRAMLRRANELLTQAGWTRGPQGLVDKAGERLTVEFLIEAQVFEKVMAPVVQALKTLGAEATIRLVDATQYQRRVEEREFDIIGRATSLSSTPLDDVEQLFSSRNADVPGGSNLSGLKDPVVDELTARVRAVRTREEMVTLLKVIDRVVRTHYIWIPNWYSGRIRAAFWDKFGWPERKPDYFFPVETTWWVDAAKAEAIGRPL
ncbi:extracellular solute-binding protein [Chthonobacter albigriseus]|uniref:extracellular solute-binding protein n=1 Tax=Chthonobacter albigriseus TaxID=1683161 RepID=UPI0015EF8B69|nr:extracellular solute-binding protein [Chthonobacter albigriseus]